MTTIPLLSAIQPNIKTAHCVMPSMIDPKTRAFIDKFILAFCRPNLTLDEIEVLSLIVETAFDHANTEVRSYLIFMIKNLKVSWVYTPPADDIRVTIVKN